MNDQNSNPFAVPEKGSLPVDRLKFPTIEYSAFKTPATFIADLTTAKIENGLSTCKLGFHFYDKDASQKIQLTGMGSTFTFVVLETYSQLSGSVESGPNQFTKYYSNKIKDSRTEEFALFVSGNKKPIMRGLYQKLKGDKEKGIPGMLPEGVGFDQVFVVYWVEGDRVMNLPLSTMVSREVKTAIAEAERGAGRSVNPEKVKLFGLADAGALWGFRFKTFRRAQKDGSDYKSGELFFVPVFYAGVIKNEGEHANPELFQKCIEWQDQVRANYAAELERRKTYGEDEQGQENQGDDANFPTSHDQGRTVQPTQTGGVDFEKRIQQPATPPEGITVPAPDDDLPF